MRRRAGLGAIQQQQLETQKYSDKGDILKDSRLNQMTKQMEVFRSKLEEFTMKHKQDIRKNPQFRRQFQEMCSAIGVDPLATGRGFWSILGMSDFYYELSVQIIEVCLASNARTGGIIQLTDLRQKLVKARGKNLIHQEISEDDILIAAKKLKIFGNGFMVHQLAKGKYMIQSVPGELSREESSVLGCSSVQKLGRVTLDELVKELGWSQFRAKQAIDRMISERLAWIDNQGEEGTEIYWFPSLFPGQDVT